MTAHRPSRIAAPHDTSHDDEDDHDAHGAAPDCTVCHAHARRPESISSTAAMHTRPLLVVRRRRALIDPPTCLRGMLALSSSLSSLSAVASAAAEHSAAGPSHLAAAPPTPAAAAAPRAARAGATAAPATAAIVVEPVVLPHGHGVCPRLAALRRIGARGVLLLLLLRT